jgi:ATP-dependent protease ClpP protease subunit
MAKQVLLYNDIYPYTAAQFLTDLEAAGDGATVRVNCPGGDPYSTYGMIAVAAKSNAKYEVDGQANSCAFFLVASAGPENVECLTASSFVAHRASTWYEKYPDMMTDAMKAELKACNDTLRGIIEDNLPEFETVMKVKLDDLFAMTYPKLDVRINAKQAKKMGLVGQVNPLTPTRKKEVEAYAQRFGIAAFSSTATTTNTKPTVDMEITTLAELKAQYPALYDAAKAEGALEGSTATLATEKRRIAAWQAWEKLAPEATAAGIASGKFPDAADLSEMQAKAFTSGTLEAMKKDNAPIPAPGETVIDPKAKTETNLFMEAANKEMGWTK